MSSQPDPKTAPENLGEVIDEVRAADRHQAQQTIAKAVRAAENMWIEAPLIVEALALELIAVAKTNHASDQVASYLRGLAESMEGQPNRH